jgi:hypothetical protein
MHCVTHKSHRMQKPKFDVMCLDALFVQSVPVPLEHEQLCINVSWLGCTEMHYVTRRSHRMEKHKIGVKCPARFFWNLYRSHPSMTRTALTSHAPPPGCKNTSSVYCVPACFFWNPYRSHLSIRNSASMFRVPDVP